MKRAELRIGSTYSDGKKGLRRIIAFGPQYKLYDSQAETDCLVYAIVAGKRPSILRGKTEAGEYLMHSTATSFAAWAKVVVMEDDEPA
jgi:hypothetical protein